jgi:hypothetical protein
VNKTLVLLIALAILLVAFAVYRSRSDRLNVDPNAAEQIEKAKRR